MELFIGIVFTCAIIVWMLFSMVQYFVSKKIIKEVDLGKTEMQKKLIGIILFMVLSLVILLIFVKKYFDIFQQTDEFANGLFFVAMTVGVGKVIQVFYKMIVVIVNKLLKKESLYKLTEEEIKWTFVIACIALAIVCYRFDLILFSEIFIVLILGKIFWLDFSFEKLKADIKSIKSLSATYWYAIIFVIVTGLVTARYTKIIEVIASHLGIIMGVMVGIVSVQLIHRKTEKEGI